MTLKEKFKQWLDTNPRLEIREVQLEVIADDYAMEFGKWLNNQVIDSSGRHHNLLGVTKITQLLPIFKKEKGI